MKKAALTAVAMLVLSGCGATTLKEEVEEELQKAPVARAIVSAEELRLYIEQEKPKAVSYIRYQQPFRWRGLNPYFAITEARRGPHLIEMSWECEELVSPDLLTDMFDTRTKSGLLRAGIDTIRGCRIENFYRLPDPEPSEEGNESGPEY